MQNQGEERWLTYAEAADLLGISPEAVRQRARRYRWPRRTPNEHGAVAHVLVPDNDRGTDRRDDRPRPALNGGQPGYNRGTSEAQPAGHDRPDTGPDIARAVRETVELLLAPLSEQLAKADQRYEAERARCDRLERQLDEERTRIADAQAAERIARDETARLRTELDARKQWGLWRRVRGR